MKGRNRKKEEERKGKFIEFLTLSFKTWYHIMGLKRSLNFINYSKNVSRDLLNLTLFLLN